MKEFFEKLKTDSALKNKVILIASAVVCVIAAVFFVYRTWFYIDAGQSDPNNGNSANGGFVIQAEDSIVLSVMHSNFTYSEDAALPEQGIIVMDSDGANTRILTREYGTNLAWDGTWLYYCNVFDQNKLYRIKLDGTEKTAVTDYPVNRVIVNDGWIYYHNIGEERIDRLNTDLTRCMALDDRVKGTNISVSGGRIYYLKGDNSRRCLFSMNPDGTDIKELADLGENGHDMMIYDGYCYFIDGTDLYRIKIGSKRHSLVRKNVAKFNISQDVLYFIDGESLFLCKCPLGSNDEAEQTEIYGNTGIGIAGEQVFSVAYDVIYRLTETGYATYGRYAFLNSSN